MNKKISVVVVPHNGQPEFKDIDDVLESYQEIVGGYIEVVPCSDGILHIVNEDGIYLDLPINQNLECYYGNVIICTQNGENFGSLSDGQARRIIDIINFGNAVKRSILNGI